MNLLFLLTTLNLWILAIDQIVCGVIGVFLPRLTRPLYQLLFGVAFGEDHALSAIIKPWSALALFSGAVTVLTIFYPQRYRELLYCIVGLLAIRMFIRWRYRHVATSYISLSPNRNMFHIVLIAICMTLVILRITLLR